MAHVKLFCNDDIFMGVFKKGVIEMMLYELLVRTDKNVPVKCMIRNEKSVTTVQGTCNFVYSKLNRNGLASNVLYIDIDDDTMIVRAE
jgi:RNase adaptor protein for sRNA GlmZ degradation